MLGPADLADVQRNLQRLLNARKGHCRACPEYGTSVLTGLYTGSSSGRLFADEIKACIRDYEPRLTNVEVEYVAGKDPEQMHFDISATLNDQSQTRFRTFVENGGRLSVRSA